MLNVITRAWVMLKTSTTCDGPQWPATKKLRMPSLYLQTGCLVGTTICAWATREIRMYKSRGESWASPAYGAVIFQSKLVRTPIEPLVRRDPARMHKKYRAGASKGQICAWAMKAKTCLGQS